MTLNKGKTLDSKLQEQTMKERQIWRQVLTRLLDVLKFLTKQNLPFRGHWEDVFSSNKGYFINLVELMSKYDSVFGMLIPAGRPHYLSFLKPLIANDSSSVFSHLWPGVFHVSLQIRKVQPKGERKEQTNKHGLGSAPTARSGEVYVTLFVHSVFLWANGSVYSSENSHKATSNADLNSRIGLPGICRSTGPNSHLSDIYWLVSFLPDSHLPDWPVLSTGSFCWLCSSLDCSLMLPSADCLLLLSPADYSLGPSFPRPSGLVRDLVRRPFVWVSRQNKGILWLVPTHRETDATHNITLESIIWKK